MTQTEKNKIEKKIDIARDKMIDLLDSGHGNDTVSRILDLLQLLYTELQIY